MSIYPLQARLAFNVDLTIEDIYRGLLLPEYADGDKVQVVLCFGAATNNNRLVVIHDVEVLKNSDYSDIAVRLNDDGFFEIGADHVFRLMDMGFGKVRPKNRHYDMQDTIDHAYRGDCEFFTNKDRGQRFDVDAIVIDFSLTLGQLDLLKKINYVEKQEFLSKLRKLKESV